MLTTKCINIQSQKVSYLTINTTLRDKRRYKLVLTIGIERVVLTLEFSAIILLTITWYSDPPNDDTVQRHAPL